MFRTLLAGRRNTKNRPRHVVCSQCGPASCVHSDIQLLLMMYIHKHMHMHIHTAGLTDPKKYDDPLDRTRTMQPRKPAFNFKPLASSDFRKRTDQESSDLLSARAALDKITQALTRVSDSKGETRCELVPLQQECQRLTGALASLKEDFQRLSAQGAPKELKDRDVHRVMVQDLRSAIAELERKLALLALHDRSPGQASNCAPSPGLLSESDLLILSGYSIDSEKEESYQIPDEIDDSVFVYLATMHGASATSDAGMPSSPFKAPAESKMECSRRGFQKKGCAEGRAFGNVLRNDNNSNQSCAFDSPARSKSDDKWIVLGKTPTAQRGTKQENTGLDPSYYHVSWV